MALDFYKNKHGQTVGMFPRHLRFAAVAVPGLGGAVFALWDGTVILWHAVGALGEPGNKAAYFIAARRAEQKLRVR